MSELKAKHAFDVYEAYTKTGDDDAAQVYLKSEADKVIAELRSKVPLACLAEDCSSLINKRCNYCSELQRQKRKRCLKLADWCGMAIYHLTEKLKHEPTAECAMFYDRRINWWHIWQKRWLVIADKFKEA